VRSILRTSIAAGLIAGTVDLGAACAINRVRPGPVLRFIASGLLGSPLPHENWVYWLGMVLQWAMSILIAAIFVIAAVKMPVLLRRWLAAGVAYGAVVFVVMNFVVVPLSRAKSGPMTVSSVVENLLAMMLFGLIIAYVARRGNAPGNGLSDAGG
jgi:uncharacterized membrane protein YagU involved in acid resistance